MTARKQLFDQNTVKTVKKYDILLQFKITILLEYIVIYSKQNFQQPSLQSSVSHDSSEMLLICWFSA